MAFGGVGHPNMFGGPRFGTFLISSGSSPRRSGGQSFIIQSGGGAGGSTTPGDARRHRPMGLDA